MIYLNIGSNLPSKEGGRENNILKAISYLKKLNLNLIKISSFYQTPSYPNNSDPKFINLCVKLESNLNPSELLNEIKKIEKKLGRIRIKKNEPRTCDIDIIDFNGEIIKNEDKMKPSSDSQIAKYFEDQGILVARRTVTKYREKLNIEKSTERRVKN